MDKYMHPNTIKPKEDSLIVVFMIKSNKVVKMSELFWSLNYTYVLNWCYVDDIVKDVENLHKYVRAYNYYRDSLKDLIDENEDKQISTKLQKIYKEATKLIVNG